VLVQEFFERSPQEFFERSPPDTAARACAR